MTLRVVAGDGPDLVDATRRLARGYAQTWAGAAGCGREQTRGHPPLEAYGFVPTEPFNEGWPGERWYALRLTGT